jgi:NAD(P)-dependent dehydrogenase (short-subunit alcohol dehydrogenase family)
MVNLSSIKLSNGQVNESSYPRVAVFVGGTDGIGKLTLAGLAGLGLNFKAYVIGRKVSQEVFKSIIEELHLANPAASVIWIEGEVSLLAEVKRVCDHIRTLETEVNLLFMTPGFAPFAGRQSTLSPPRSCRKLTQGRYF